MECLFVVKSSCLTTINTSPTTPIFLPKYAKYGKTSLVSQYPLVIPSNGCLERSPSPDHNFASHRLYRQSVLALSGCSVVHHGKSPFVFSFLTCLCFKGLYCSAERNNYIPRYCRLLHTGERVLRQRCSQSNTLGR